MDYSKRINIGIDIGRVRDGKSAAAIAVMEGSRLVNMIWWQSPTVWLNEMRMEVEIWQLKQKYKNANIMREQNSRNNKKVWPLKFTSEQLN